MCCHGETIQGAAKLSCPGTLNAMLAILRLLAMSESVLIKHCTQMYWAPEMHQPKHSVASLACSFMRAVDRTLIERVGP